MAQKRRKKPLPPLPKIFEDDTFVRNGSSQYIKKYKRGKMLGKGGFAVCYEATSFDSRRKYAAKVVYKSNLKKKEKQKKLVNEIQIHRQLNHAHIVKLERHFEDSEHVYILLELCSSMTLMEMLKKRGQLTEAETQYFMLQLIDAVSYLHNMNIIHRDLKLGNIFLSEDLKVKLGDFGLAAIADENGRRFSVCGTPNYIAPEVLAGSKRNGHSFEVDIWSLGVIMFTLLCGKPPFETRNVQSTYKKIKKLSYEFPPNIELSKHAKHLISRLLVLDATQRPNLDEIRSHTFFTYRTALTSLPKSALTRCWPVPTRARDGPSLNRKRALGATTPETQRRSKRPCTFGGVWSTPVGFAKEIDQIEEIPHRPRCISLSPEQDQENAYNEPVKRKKPGGRRARVKDPPSVPVHYDDGFRRPALPARSSRLNTPTSKDPSSRPDNSRSACPEPEPPPKQAPPPKPALVRNDTQALQSIYSEIERSFRQEKTRSDAPTDRCRSKNSSSEEEQLPHPRVWVCRWVDYARKYGVGYYLTNGCTGVYFNDATKIVLHPDRESFTYVDRPAGSKSDTAVHHSLTKHPQALSKKVMLLKHFKEYLHKAGEVTPPTTIFNPHRDLIYLKMWTRTKHAILFRLCNKTVQINFMDNTELILSSETRLVTYTDKQKMRITYRLKDILTTTRKDLRKRMRYTQDILKTLLDPKRQ